VAFVRPGLEYASCVCSPHQEVHSASICKICIARSGLDY
jgi:hypothetical protein